MFKNALQYVPFAKKSFFGRRRLQVCSFFFDFPLGNKIVRETCVNLSIGAIYCEMFAAQNLSLDHISLYFVLF